ncbi:MAG: hypothetical protein RQ760_22045 [Sedimentisphaerales bacterium]|nr:hypothetical protein [Sedimentisphaerales bacterium]
MQKRKTKQDSRLKTQNPGHITFVFGLWSVVCGLLLAGCAEQQQYQATEPLLMENADKLRVMEAAEDVLVKMYFTIEKANAENGFIRTKPLQGAQFFELWRSDSVGTGNWLLNNLHSIRRIVELNISEQDKDLYINCNVNTYRLSLPEREIRSAHAYDLFSVSSPALQRIQLHPEQKEDMAWIDLGKDEQLAAEILKRIQQQIVSGQTASNKI